GIPCRRARRGVRDRARPGEQGARVLARRVLRAGGRAERGSVAIAEAGAVHLQRREAMMAWGRWVAAALCASTSSAHACYVATLALQFGAIHPSAPAPADSVGQISVTCSDAPGTLVHYRLSLSAGSAGAFAPRTLRSGTDATLKYNLYVDPARSLVWGDGN